MKWLFVKNRIEQKFHFPTNIQNKFFLNTGTVKKTNKYVILENKKIKLFTFQLDFMSNLNWVFLISSYGKTLACE